MAALLTPAASALQAQQTAPGLPGYQIAEIKDGRLTSGYGGAATPQTAVNEGTLFQVASCSKTVNALAVMTLVRDGRVALDRPANQYLRRWQLPGPRGADATVAELMSHTAGTTVDGFAGYGPSEKLPDLMDILAGRTPANSAAIRTRRRILGVSAIVAAARRSCRR
uniref:Serine hydrolase domain-containing protein n=1 Tax=Yoonia rhodophyticola TaxID=3137370 RepID=A0AAN0M9S2_9RHOB